MYLVRWIDENNDLCEMQCSTWEDVQMFGAGVTVAAWDSFRNEYRTIY